MIFFGRFIAIFTIGFFSLVFAMPVNAEGYQNIKTVKPVTKAAKPPIDTVVIRFDYKQSALFQSYTLDALDSIAKILKKDKRITLSIDGYAYKDEGSDTICYYLSLNRALFIKTYVLGRGIDSSRITALNAFGKNRQKYLSRDKDGYMINCRAELRVQYPIPPELFVEPDRDEDGVADKLDKCPDVFGYKDNNGCSGEKLVIVPFPVEQSTLYSMTYKVLDSVITSLLENPSLFITIDGHAFVAEGSTSVCNTLSTERAEIVKQYLLSRYVPASRIVSVKSYSTSRPINSGKTHLEIIKNARAEITFVNK